MNDIDAEIKAALEAAEETYSGTVDLAKLKEYALAAAGVADLETE